MYQVGAWLELFRGPRRAFGGRPQTLSANVFFLGLTSLFTDISSEMMVAILPMYLVGFLRLSPVQFGFVDGLYQGLSGVVQIAGGVLTDRLRRYKELAGVGYLASACSRLGLMVSAMASGESEVPRPWTLLRNPGFHLLTVSTLLLSLMTVSDAFVYLILQLRTGIPIAGFPLLYVGTSAAYLLLAVPVGHLADRVGRFPIFISGYAVLILLYAGLLSPYRGAWLPVAILALLGLYYAATEGVLMALGSSLVAGDVRARGLAVLTTATAMARLASSVAVGFAWTYLGLDATLLVFGAGLMIAVAISWLVMPGGRNQTASA